MYVDSDTGCIYSSYDLYKKDQKEVDNYFKSKLIETGKYDNFKKYQYALYSKFCSNHFGTDMNKFVEKYLGAELNLSSYEEKLCWRIYNAYRKKISRLKKKIEFNIQNFDCVFLTLTFKNKVLKKTSSETRRRYIQRFCKNLDCPWYCANIDFGDKDKNPKTKHREHYHALVRMSYVNMKKYDYGWIYAEKVKKTSNSSALAKYINKLTSHALKDSTGLCNRLIYSR